MKFSNIIENQWLERFWFLRELQQPNALKLTQSIFLGKILHWGLGHKGTEKEFFKFGA